MKRSQRLRLTLLAIVAAAPFVAYAQETAVPAERVQDLPVLGPKPFTSYFRAIPVRGELSTSAWGAKEVGPRDPANGLEDPTLTRWNYWDGQILRGQMANIACLRAAGNKRSDTRRGAGRRRCWRSAPPGLDPIEIAG